MTIEQQYAEATGPLTERERELWYDYFAVTEFKAAENCTDEKKWRKVFYTFEDSEQLNHAGGGQNNMALRVDTTGNATGFTRMLDDAKLQAKIFSRDLAAEINASFTGQIRGAMAGMVGMFSVSAITSAVSSFINTGKEIKDVSEQLDMSTDSWQKWSDAVNRAGLSTDGFNRVVEALRQKRTDALTDPKARGQLTRLGFSDADITGNMGMDAFLKKALANANDGDLQRGYLADIIGNRSLKYASALNQLPNSQALYSPGDIEDATTAADCTSKPGGHTPSDPHWP